MRPALLPLAASAVSAMLIVPELPGVSEGENALDFYESFREAITEGLYPQVFWAYPETIATPYRGSSSQSSANEDQSLILELDFTMDNRILVNGAQLFPSAKHGNADSSSAVTAPLRSADGSSTTGPLELDLTVSTFNLTTEAHKLGEVYDLVFAIQQVDGVPLHEPAVFVITVVTPNMGPLFVGDMELPTKAMATMGSQKQPLGLPGSMSGHSPCLWMSSLSGSSGMVLRPLLCGIAAGLVLTLLGSLFTVPVVGFILYKRRNRQLPRKSALTATGFPEEKRRLVEDCLPDDERKQGEPLRG